MRLSNFPVPAILVGIAVLFSLACTSMTSPMVNPPSADVTIVKGASTLGASAFSPNPFTTSLTGTNAGKVAWVNADYTSTYNGNTGTTHHLVSDTGLWPAGSGTMGPAGTFSYTFTAAGSYAYHCSIHPGMTGTITVTP